MLVEPGKSFAQVATTVADNGISPGVASFFTGIAISMYCPQMMGSIGNGTFLNMLQRHRVCPECVRRSDCPEWQDCPEPGLLVAKPRLWPAPSRARPLGWTCGPSQSDPRPGRRTRRARHRRPLPHRPRPDRRRRRARRKDLPLRDDRAVRGARRRQHLHRHRRRHRQQRHPQRDRARRLRLRRVHRHPPARSAGAQRARRRRRVPLLQHRRGPAPLRRPGRQRGLPLLAVRNRRRQKNVRVFRPARPEGVVRHHRHRARALAGDLQRRAGRRRRPTATPRSTRSQPRRG